MNEVDLLKRKLEQEQAARKQAVQNLEPKTLDDYQSDNSQLKLYERIEQQVAGISEQEIRLLVVEDNLMNQKYISILLNNWKIPFDIAKNGQLAVDSYKSQHYDLVFMDLSMPVMNGYEATSVIRSLHGDKTPIIALTASTSFSRKERTLQAGMTDFLAKPFTPEELLTMIHRHLPKNAKTELGKPKQKLDTLQDSGVLNSLYNGDQVHALNMFKTYISVIDQELETLINLMKSENTAAVRKQVHKIKPMFSMVGLQWITDACAEVKSALSKKNTIEIQALINNIVELATQSKGLINQEIELLEGKLK